MSSFTVGTKSGAKTVQSGSAPIAKKVKVNESIKHDPFGRSLSLYQLPPIGEVTPDEFETLAVERLRCTTIHFLNAHSANYSLQTSCLGAKTL